MIYADEEVVREAWNAKRDHEMFGHAPAGRAKLALEYAKIVASKRARVGTAFATLEYQRIAHLVGGAVIEVPAGYIATSPAVRYVGLREKERDQITR